jgi:hypothetical protein
VRADDVLTVADQLAKQHLHYVYGSEDLTRGGLDCSAFTRLVFKQAAALELPEQADWQFEYVRLHGVIWDAASSWTPDLLQPGDLVFFAGKKKVDRISQISHVMIYCGHGLVVGAQGEGRQADGSRPGVGYFRFRVRPPRGITGESGERFVGHWSVFAYGRLNVGPVLATNGVTDAQPEEEIEASAPAFFLQPAGINPRFD